MSDLNVLLVTIDSLRYDRVTDGQDNSPFLSRLREEAVSFTTAVANGSATRSSFPTILTSTHPLMYGGYSYLSDERPFIAETLSENGFQTVGFHSNPHLGAEQNYDSGFEDFNDTAEGSESVASLKDRVERRLDPDSHLYSLLRRLWHYFTISTDTSAYAKAPTITDNAIDWFESKWKGDSFFMWLHYMDVHYPFTPPDRFLRELDIDPLSKRRVAELNGKMQERPNDLTQEDVEDLLKLYDGEIRYCDHHIGHIIKYLNGRNVLNDTIIIVTADHGEAFGEHGLFGHSPHLYDELLRVPLLIYGPGIDPDQIDRQVSLIDLGPTLYDLVDVETPEEVQGTSFEPMLRGEAMDKRTAICTAASGDMLACRTSEWKCFWRVAEEEVELYDLREDPDESRDVSDDHPTVVEEFRDRMEAYLKEAEASNIDLPDSIRSEDINQRLKDLGYVE